MGAEGIEPVTAWVKATCSTFELYAHQFIYFCRFPFRRTFSFGEHVVLRDEALNGGGGRIRTYEHPDSESGGFDLLHTLPYGFARGLRPLRLAAFLPARSFQLEGGSF